MNLPIPQPQKPTFTRTCFKRSANGFSLIELLICIAIVAVLAGIMIPVVSTIRESARQAECSSNMRQVGQAVQLYQSDNDGLLPPNWASSGGNAKNTWTMQLRPYLDVENQAYGTATEKMSTYLACPSLEETLQPDTWWESNYAVGPAFGRNGEKQNVVDVDTARLVMLAENNRPNARSLDYSGGWWSSIGYNHNGQANILFHDGHLEQWTEETTPTDNNDPAWKK